MGLPSVDLHNMQRLKHIRLDNCLPGRELALPADCSMFLDGLCYDYNPWQEHHRKFQRHTTVLQLVSFDHPDWPPGIESFSSLQYLEVDTHYIWDADLATLQHIPRVRVIMYSFSELQLTAGSWETLEIFHFGLLELSIGDMDSFVRNTREFTFTSQSPPKDSDVHVLIIKIQNACLRHKACHVFSRHIKRCEMHGVTDDRLDSYVILSTNKEMAEKFPVNLQLRQGSSSWL